MGTGRFSYAALAVGALILLLLVFEAGVFVGYKKALFSYQWEENYHRNFGGQGFMNAHGIFGTIIKIDGNTLVIKGKDNIEKIVLVSDDTIIREDQNTIHSADLKIDDHIVIIGSPNGAGQVEAKFIRLFK